MAEKYNFLIVEDDVYGWLSFDGPSPPSLKADDEMGPRHLRRDVL